MLALASWAAGGVVTEYHWTVDGKPPTTIDDLHLHFQIQATPFVFGAPLIDDKGRFGTADATTPGPDGGFAIDFDLASPAYDPTDNVHVAFNFTSSEDVKLVFAEWTFGQVVVGTAQNLDVQRVATPISTPGSLALALAGLMLLGTNIRRWGS